MDIISETLIAAILNVIGGTIRWCFASIWHAIFNTPKHKFKEYLYDSDANTLIDDEGTGCFNIIIGLAFVALVIAIILNT